MESQFDSIFSAIQGSDNAKREQAEVQLQQLCQENTLQAVEMLVKVIQLGQPGVSEIACLLLQKKIILKPTLFQKLQGTHIQAIMEAVKALVRPESSMGLLKRISDILGTLYMLTNKMSDYFQYLGSFSENSDSKIKIFVLYALETFAEYIYEDEILVSSIQEFASLFDRHMQDSEPKVKFAAASSLTNFLAFIKETSCILSFQQVFPKMIALMVEAIKFDEENGLKMINSIESLIKMHPKFIAGQEDSLLDVYTEIFISTELSNGLRNASLTSVLTLADFCKVAVKKSPIFANKTLPHLVKVLAQQEDDVTSWLKVTDDIVEISNQETHACVLQELSHLNSALGSKFLIPKLISFVVECINSQDWKQKYAGLMTLAMVFEGVKENFQTEYDNFCGLVVPTLQNDQPKVSYAAMTCVGLLSEEFTPEFQKQHSGVAIPAVTNIIKTSPHHKLRLRGVSCMISYLRELLMYEEEIDCIVPYVGDLMQATIGFFEPALAAEDLDSVEEALALISILAGLLGEQFGEFYERLMPGMKTLLSNTPNDNEKQNKLRHIIISTIGHMLGSHSNNPALVKDDIVEIMGLLSAMQGQLAEDDNQHRAILEVYGAMLKALGPEFVPFMDKLIDQVIRCGNRQIQLTATDSYSLNKTKGASELDNAIEIDLKMMGGKKILSLNPCIVEQKIQAMHLAKDVFKILKKDARPYFGQLLPLLSENLNFKASKMVASFCQKALYHVLGCLDTEAEMAEVFLKFVVPMLQNASFNLNVNRYEDAHKILKRINKSFALFTSKDVLSEQFMNQYIETLVVAQNVSQTGKQAVLAEWGNPQEMDAETLEDFEYEYDVPNMLMHDVMTACMNIMKLYGTQIEQVIINKLGGYFFNYAQNFVVEDEIHYSTLFYAELFNYCSEQVVKQGYQKVLELVLPSVLKTEDVNYTQTASYLFGVSLLLLIFTTTICSRKNISQINNILTLDYRPQNFQTGIRTIHRKGSQSPLWTSKQA